MKTCPCHSMSYQSHGLYRLKQVNDHSIQYISNLKGAIIFPRLSLIFLASFQMCRKYFQIHFRFQCAFKLSLLRCFMYLLYFSFVQLLLLFSSEFNNATLRNNSLLTIKEPFIRKRCSFFVWLYNPILPNIQYYEKICIQKF